MVGNDSLVLGLAAGGENVGAFGASASVMVTDGLGVAWLLACKLACLCVYWIWQWVV